MPARVRLRGPDLAIAFEPLRFDDAVPPGKGKYDVVQQFKFCGGTSFRYTGGWAIVSVTAARRPKLHIPTRPTPLAAPAGGWHANSKTVFSGVLGWAA
jgi:hypothetical protein